MKKSDLAEIRALIEDVIRAAQSQPSQQAEQAEAESMVTLTARVPRSTMEALSGYAQSRGMNRSVALRQILDAALDAVTTR